MRSEALFQEYTDSHRPHVIAVVGEIIDACRDGERGYALASTDVDEPWLKRLFWQYSHQRAQFAGALEEQLGRLGARVEAKPTVGGWIHRKWLELRSTLDHRAAIGVLLECERGENAALAKYEHALASPLPRALQEMLLSQLGEIRDAHDRLDRMRGRSLSVTSV